MKGQKKYFYNEPRLEMSVFGRGLVRSVTFFSYGALLTLMAVLVVNEIPLLRMSGVLLLLFLLDRFARVGRAEESINSGFSEPENIAAYMSPRAYKIIERAYDKSRIDGSDFGLNVLRLLLKRPEIKKVFLRIDVDYKEFINKLNHYALDSQEHKETKKEILERVQTLVVSAFNQAKRHFDKALEPHDLLGAVESLRNSYIEKLFTIFEVRDADFETAFIFARESARSVGAFAKKKSGRRHRIMNRAWTARPTPFLDRFSDDITNAARAGKGALLIGHEAEYERLVNILSRPNNPNALLIGDPGSGKEVSVHHLAFQITKDRVAKPLFDKRLISLSISALVSGADGPEVEERINKILDEIRRAGNVVLYIPDIHDLVKTSGVAHLSGADVLLPALKSAEFSVIGGTYPREYKRDIESDNDFVSAFEPIMINEISQAEAVRYLIFRSLIFERERRVIISFGAVKKAVELAHKYFHQKLLPGSAEDLLSEAIADVVKLKERVVGVSDVIETAEKKTNIQIKKVGEEEAKSLLGLEDEIHEKYINQDVAVSAVSNALRQYRSGLARKGGPIAAFLFVGPTGVGKTELAKILAEKQFGDKSAIVRFDMTEYQDKQSIARLIGASDGSTGGNLTDAIRERPYSLILLDEFEKAHPDILNIFLQVFDDGRLTDNMSRTVSFENTVIIATSNAHSTLIKEEVEAGTSMEEISEILKKRLTEFFKPELVNRFTDIIVFKTLSKESIKLIAELNLAELNRSVQETHAIELGFDDSAVNKLVELGYDPVFGARPLRRTISTRIKNSLADKILRQEVLKGSKIVVGYYDDEFVFDVRGE